MRFAVFCLLLSACASTNPFGESRRLKFKNDVTVTSADGKESQHKSGDEIPFSNTPVFVESPGNVGLLVVPAQASSGSIDVRLRRADSWRGSDFNREVNQRLNNVLDRIFAIQKSLGARQGQEALRQIESLQAQYPELSYLDFLKASAFVLTGERERARSAVESALASFPDNASGRALLRSLGGTPSEGTR